MSLVFPDVNVWLALAATHSHRSLARVWWDKEAGPITFCRFTQIGLLRLLTTPAVLGEETLGMRQAWKVYDTLFSDERVEYAEEPSPIERSFREMSSHHAASPKFWADAYLAAFAKEMGGIVVTFDRALVSRFSGILLS
jgi:toxin-antitoxin system PIN domain toxin